MADKGFRVDTDKLEAVAEKVKRLLDDVSGNTGYVAGSQPDFAKADRSQLQGAISPLWNNSSTDPFSDGYGYEHDGLVKTYQSMISQLTSLYTACQTTAQNYKHEDGATKKNVNTINPGEV